MQRIQFDLVDLTRYQVENEQYCWLLNIIDVFSKYAYSVPMKNKNGDTVKKKLEKYCSLFGFPKIVQSDNGMEFSNKIISNFWKTNFVLEKHSKPRHLQANGQIEPNNHEVNVKKFVFRRQYTVEK